MSPATGLARLTGLIACLARLGEASGIILISYTNGIEFT